MSILVSSASNLCLRSARITAEFRSTTAIEVVKETQLSFDVFLDFWQMHLGDTAHLAVRSWYSTALASIAAVFSAVNTSSGYIF